MAIPDLDSVTALLDQTCRDVLGETIQYAANGTTFAAVRAHVDYRDGTVSFDNATMISQDIRVSVLKSDVPVRPAATVRLTVAKRAGMTFKPVNVRSDESGTHWEFELGQVASA